MDKCKGNLMVIGCLFFFLVSLFSLQAEEFRLTYDDSTSGVTSIAMGKGDNLHLVWTDDREGNWAIYYKKWDGNKWGPFQELVSGVNTAHLGASISTVGDTVHTVWVDNRNGNWEIYYRRSITAGSSWEADVRLTYDGARSIWGVVKADGNKVHIVWGDDRDGDIEIFYKNSLDGGTSWESSVSITSDSVDSWLPSMAVSGDKVYIAWYNVNLDGTREIYFTSSTDAGASWRSPVKLVPSKSFAALPSISAQGSYVHLVWQDYRNQNYDIYYMNSADGGLTWSQEQRLTFNERDELFPEVICIGERVSIVWQEGVIGKTNLYLIESRDNGHHWDTPVEIVTGTKTSHFPLIAANPWNTYIAWSDNRDGNWEVYFKGPPGPPVLSGFIRMLTLRAHLSWTFDPRPYRLRYYRLFRKGPASWEILYTGTNTSYTDPDPYSVGEARTYKVVAYLHDRAALASNELTLRLDDPCPTLYTWTGDGFEMDNSLLRGSGTDTVEIVDYYKLKKALVERDGVYSLEVREIDGTESYFDRLNLLAVDHPAEVEVGVTADGIVFPYTVTAVPAIATGPGGQNYAVALSRPGDGQVYQAPAGTVGEVELKAEFGIIEPAPDGVIKRAIRIDAAPKLYPMTVRVTVAGETVTYTDLDLRRGLYAIYIPLELVAPEEAVEGLEVTLFLNGFHKVDVVQVVNRADIPILVKPCSLLSANYSYGSCLKDALLLDDGNYAGLVPGETIELSYDVPSFEENGWNRGFIMVSNGYYHPVAPPVSIIENAITELEELKAGLGEDAIEEIDDAISYLTESLNPDWWIDERHLSLEDGEDVFDLHKDAVEEITEELVEELIDEHEWTPEQIEALLGWVEANIIKADKLLALTLFAEVQKAGIAEEELEEIIEYIRDAYEYIENGELVSASEAFGSAWEESADILIELADGGGAQTAGGIPKVFSLSQNYPNPARGRTVISYQLPVRSDVSLKIYDISGRLVRTLVDGKVEAGYYSARFDGRGLASGVYFARLTAGDYTATRKLVLMR